MFSLDSANAIPSWLGRQRLIFPPLYSLRTNCVEFLYDKDRSSLLRNLRLNLIIGP